MAKADLVLANGTKVSIEGTADEVASLLRTYNTPGAAPAAAPAVPVARRRSEKKKSNGDAGVASRRNGPTATITALRNEGWFTTKRTVNDVQKALEERGQIYALKSVSQFLLQLVRKADRPLRRIDEGGVWKYVQ